MKKFNKIPLKIRFVYAKQDLYFSFLGVWKLEVESESLGENIVWVGCYSSVKKKERIYLGCNFASMFLSKSHLA